MRRPPPPNCMSKHVLIVDDEARIREVVQYALAKEGFTVSCAADGRAALQAIEGLSLIHI